mgnify:CR=1 FL=1
MDITTITLDKSMKRKLDRIKMHPRESYNDVVARLISGSLGSVSRESLVETVEILSDADAMMSIAKSLDDMRKGRTYSMDEV